MKRIDAILRSLPGYRPDGLPVPQALEIIRAVVQPVEQSERIALRSALDRVLAEDIVSPIDVPGYDSAAMDGWALRFTDLVADRDTELSEIGTAYAGRPFSGEVGQGQCVRIMTGAVMPAGTDTVIMQEFVRGSGGRVVIPPGQRPGMNRRFAGEDVAKGQAVLKAGTIIRPAAIGLAASLGITELQVRRRLRVAFFSSGDELTPLGEVLKAGQVYDSNRHTLWAMLARLGCETIDLGVVRDEPALLEAALRRGAGEADAIITTGGASEGEADFTREIAAHLGEVVFWKLAARPGRPFAFGRIDNALFFGLPGNPVAAMVAFYRLVRPAVLAMAGVLGADPPVVRARLAEGLRKRAGREEVMRAVIQRDSAGEPSVRLTLAQGSAMVTSMCTANCLVVLPAERNEVRSGEWVDVILLDSLV